MAGEPLVLCIPYFMRIFTKPCATQEPLYVPFILPTPTPDRLSQGKYILDGSSVYDT